MERNQLASEIAKEYETMAVNAECQIARLKQQNPFEEFPALRRHITFCKLMKGYWDGVAGKLESGSSLDNWDAQESEGPTNTDWGFYE